MPIAVERKPRPHWPAMPQCTQHCPADHLVKHIMGISECCPDWLCFLSQEPCGFQCPKIPFTLSLYFHLHIRLCLQLFYHLFLRPSSLHRQPLSCRLLYFLFLFTIFFLYPSPHHPLTSPLSHGMLSSLYARLKDFAHLQVTTRHICLAPSCPHDEFIQGPAEHLHDSYRAHPWHFIQSYQATSHYFAIGGPGGGSVYHRVS